MHPSAQLAWALASREARAAGSARIEPLHFLAAVLLIADDCFQTEAQTSGLPSGAVEEIKRLGVEARRRLGVSDDRITATRRHLAKSMRRTDHAAEAALLHRSDASRALFHEAVKRARDMGSESLNVLHLLDALLGRMQAGSDAGEPDRRLSSLVHELGSQVSPAGGPARPGTGGASALDELGRDLTALARDGRLPPVAGRRKEMTALARHLLRTTKRNVLLIGEAGVGKTFAAECLGRVLFPDDRGAVARFNMNEFKERHEIARLAGAPPGFVGHDQPGALFRFAEANPRGLFILDEMEKAHPEIQDYFLQIFDKGEAQDSRGRKVDFRPYVFVMTSNVGAGAGTKSPIGFAAAGGRKTAASVRRVSSGGEITRFFRREFLARVNGVIPFRPLGRDAYLALLERRFDALARQVEQERAVSLRMAEAARSRFADLCAGQPEGCRGFEKLFGRMIAGPVARRAGECRTGEVLCVAGFADGETVFEATEGVTGSR
jgi:ATP-dependent Clp protease ATP-binding subunit ClpA